MQDALREIVKKYDGRVLVKKLPFPLSELTFRAAEAVLCVKDSNQREEMSRFIYKKQEKWRTSRYPESLWKSFAKSSGADLIAWEKCLKKRNYLEKIKKIKDLGLGLGVRGTPTFFVGESKMEGSKSIGRLKKVIQKKIFKFKKKIN